MKYSYIVIAANVFSIICAIVAAYMALNKIEGWGWFLFVAVICFTSISSKKE